MTTNLNTFFLSVDLGHEIGGPTDGALDLAGLDFGLVLHEDTDPVQQRFTTWGLNADSAVLYQTLTDTNHSIIANQGNLYVLDDTLFTDNGVPFTVTKTTIPLPAPQEDEATTAFRRLHHITWQVRTPPPLAGYLITVTVFDADNSSRSISKQLIQTETKMNLSISIEARQFVIQWECTTNVDFDPLSVGLQYQLVNRPYTRSL